MSIEGIEIYARCLNCGDVIWTSSQEQEEKCRCDFLILGEGKVKRALGGIDRGFTDEHMQAHYDGKHVHN